MPFLKAAFKAVFIILGLSLSGLSINNAYGNLAELSPSQQKYLRKDTTTTNKIMKLVHMEIASEGPVSKIPEKDYLDEAYSLAKRTGNLGFLSTQLNITGNKERFANHYPAALSLYSRGLKIAEEIKDTDLIIHFYTNMGFVDRKIDNYQDALGNIVKAIQLTKMIHDSLGMAIALNNLGNTQIQLGQYNDALNSFKQSMKVEQYRKNKIGLAINLNNIGNAYHLQKKNDKAINYYNLSLEIDRQINSKKGMAICYNDLATAYRDLGHYNKCFEYAQKALTLSKEVDFVDQEAVAHLVMGESYFNIHKNKDAIENFKKGIKLIRPLGSRAFLVHAYKMLYKIYLDREDYRDALSYLRSSYNYRDTILNLRVQNNIARLQIQYKTQQKENQIILLDQEAKLVAVNEKKQRYLIYFLLSASLLMLIVLTFVVASLSRRRENNRILKLKNKEIEEARKDLENNEKELIKAKEEAEKNALAKSQIMADLSHEIRTPLNSVIGFSDLLHSSLEDKKQKKYLEAIGASGKGLLKLIDEILNASKQDHDDLPLELTDFDIRECVQEVNSIFALKAEEKNITLKANFSDELPQIIHFNKMILQQILLNLIGNAIKFTEAGQVKILVSSKKDDEKGTILLNFEIKDTGIGIPVVEQKKIFKPFYQVGSSVKQEGSGLGLSITENLVKKMNGTIRLISKKNKGSRFIISFNGVKASQDERSINLMDALMTNIQKLPFLFLSQEDTALAKNTRYFFEKSGFDLLDVGINLAKAREHFQDCYLIILCCLGQEELTNTLSILEKENLKNDHRFLIISKNSDIAVSGQDKTILTISENMDLLPQKLKDFLESYQEEMLEFLLFAGNQEVMKNPEIKNAFHQIFRNEFKEACSTHMLDNISELAKSLKEMGTKYELINMVAFSATLEQNISQFDTQVIDKQLNILGKAFNRSFHFK